MVKVDMTLDLPAILSAHERIRPHVHRTLVLTSSRLDEASGASLFFKCENFQKIGAFKARGATNAVLSLDEAVSFPQGRDLGLIAVNDALLSLSRFDPQQTLPQFFLALNHLILTLR